MNLLLLRAFGLCLGLCCLPVSAAEKRPPNILFIAVDDLNHWVGHLGRNPQTKTPHLDRLAAMGVTFSNAHCAAPVCNPSRAALLSGKRPGTTGVYDNNHPYKDALQPTESLVTHFKTAGYQTLGMGKIWHGGLGWQTQWTETKSDPKQRGAVQDRSIGGIRFGILEGGDECLPDTATADYARAVLTQKHDQPYFLALGFHKPHMPWQVPQKYFDLHPLDGIALPPHLVDDLSDLPPAALKMAKASGDHATVLESGRWKEAVQAYLAAISYLDGQIGRVLDAYEASPDKEHTLICLWGDHGWHLGEKQHWRKFSLWEESTRAPFIWVVPGLTKPGGVCRRPVDFMSVFPTLCSLAALPAPAWLEGQNIKPLLHDPAAAWPHPAITTFGQNNHAIRTERWRYIRYADGSGELYDHANDPYEWKNLVLLPENATLVSDLARQLPVKNLPPALKEDSADGKAKRRLEKRQAKGEPKNN